MAAKSSQSSSSSSTSSSALVCEAPPQPQVCEQPAGNEAAQQNMSGGPGAGQSTAATPGGGGPPPATPAGGAEWWKTAPKLEIPWPPGAEKQSKRTIGWDAGPNYQYAFPEAKWPSDGRETLFEAPPLQLQTPVPGVVVDLFAKAEYGLSFGGMVGGSIKKEGADKYTVTGSGSVSGKASIGIKGGVGLGVGGAGVSLGISGNLAATVEAALTGSIQFSMTYNAGAWSGDLKAPLKFETALKVTPSASLYVKVLKWNKDLATLSFGEWTIATAGVDWTPGVRAAAGGFTNTTAKPKLIGPQWGAPPEVAAT